MDRSRPLHNLTVVPRTFVSEISLVSKRSDTRIVLDSAQKRQTKGGHFSGSSMPAEKGLIRLIDGTAHCWNADSQIHPFQNSSLLPTAGMGGS